MRARIQSCTAGPQTILGAEGVLHQEELEPVLADRRVLVVDDEPVIRQTVCAVLEQRGCAVEVCTDGTSAIEMIKSASEQQAPFDLVISDVRMPDRNGYEVFRAAKDSNEGTPVILMTGFGYDPHHSIVRSSQEGLHCFLFKPFQIEQLLEEVYKALVIEPREK
jgi:DNA-binding NtrC family response regulator